MKKARQEGKQRTQEHPGVTWHADGMILEGHAETLKHLDPMLMRWMECAKCDTQREKCTNACVR